MENDAPPAAEADADHDEEASTDLEDHPPSDAESIGCEADGGETNEAPPPPQKTPRQLQRIQERLAERKAKRVEAILAARRQKNRERKQQQRAMNAEVDGEKDDAGANPGDATCTDDPGDTTSCDADTAPPAQWMSGKWGLGWRIHAGHRGPVYRYNVQNLVDQVKAIPGLGYVLFNLSQGAKGDKYLAPHSVLSKINPKNCPKRDLFGELATAFQEAGLKVICYMATEGPAQLKHGKPYMQGIQNWKAWVKEKYGSDDVPTLKVAYAEVIVREFAERYTTKIDGWWFDHASFGDVPLLEEIVKTANPNCIVAFCNAKLGVPLYNRNPDLEDFTSGHPKPVRRVAATSGENECMVRSVEESEDGFLYGPNGEPSLGHMFMPMRERWNSGENIVWTEDVAVHWMQRVLNAGGAWTWNIPSIDHLSQLCVPSVEFASRVSEQLQLRYL